jgi:hypothetical protein
MAAIWEVIRQQGLFCALYSDRGSLFWHTPKGGGPVERERLTQLGRALGQLGVQMIPAYSPQARGRSERSFGTWQGRLPQELRLRGITGLDAANQFLRDDYIAEFNQHFQVAAQRGTAFVACARRDLDLIFAPQFERTVNRDNTVSFQNLKLQMERVARRATLTGCNVVVHWHLDGGPSITHGAPSGGAVYRAGRALFDNENAGGRSYGKDAHSYCGSSFSIITGHFTR